MMQKEYLLMAGGLAFAVHTTSPAQNAKFLLVHSVKVRTETYTLFPPELDPSDIPAIRYEEIKPSVEEKTVITKIDMDYQEHLEIIIDTLSRTQDWMEGTHRIVSTPTTIAAFTSTGKKLFHEPLSEEEVRMQAESANQVASEGYHPGFPVFPFPDSTALDEFRKQGNTVSHPMSEMVRIDFKEGGYLQFDRKNHVISEGYETEDGTIEVHRGYVFDERYGFLPDVDTEMLRDKTDELGLVKVTQRSYSDHEIKDKGILQKADEERSGDLRFYPIPLEGHLTIEGIRKDVVIERIWVKDQTGKVLFTYPGNQANSLKLPTVQWPSGFLILEAQTDQGSYSQPIIKP